MEDIVTSDQTHTANVRVVTEEDRGNGITKPRPYTDVDGMVTNVPGAGPGDILRGLCAFVFCGSGTASNWTVSFRMERNSRQDRKGDGRKRWQKNLEADRRIFSAAVGPSICQDCYEVSEDVIETFAGVLLTEKYWDALFYRKENGKYQLNLWEANQDYYAGSRD